MSIVSPTIASISTAVVPVSGLSISRPLAVVVASVATIPMVSSTISSIVSSVSVVTIAGLSISRPLAIITMMSIGVRRSVSVSVSVVSEVSSVITIAGLSSGGWLSLSLSLSISGPLAVVVSSVASIIPSTISSISMAVVPVSRLGSNNSEEDDGESNQKFHVVRSSFST